MILSLYEWKDREKSIDSFPVPPLALKRLQSPRGQEKSNKRPSLDCCSFKPLKQRESP